MKKILTLFATLIVAMATFGQNNVFKIQPIPLALKKFDVTYERALTKRTSFAFAGSMMLDSDISLNALSLDDATVGGWSVWPQFRIYPGIKESPKGFYLAPYLSYSRYSVAYSDTFNLESSSNDVQAAATGIISSFSAGGLLGIQWVFDNHFTIDWHFLGVGYSFYDVAIEVQPEDGTVSISELAAAVEEGLANTRFISDYVDVSSAVDKVQVSAPFSQIGLRSGISIGFAF